MEPGPHQPSGSICFGVFEVDLRAGELRKHGLLVRLQEQPFRVLEMLVIYAGEVVTREEIQKKLWPADTFVDFDHGLNKAINKIREALRDSAESPRFIETVTRRGYRFIADVRFVDQASSPFKSEPSAEGAPGAIDDLRVVATPEVSPTGRWKLTWTLAGIAAIFVVAMVAAWLVRSWRGASPSFPIRSLAVLPMENLSCDASQDYFADGITEELITDLAHIGALRVISRTSMMSYKLTRKTMPQIARELNVEAVVEGTVLRSGDQVRITAQLIQAPDDKHLWAHSYEGDVRDTLVLQRKVALAIAEQVRINLTPREQAVLKRAKAVNPEAFEAYLLGRYFWNKRTAEGLKKAVEYFNEAIARDPNYSQAYAGLADSYALLGNSDFDVLSPREANPKAKAAATKALELDNSLGEAHTSLAFCLGLFEWNWEAAEKEYLQAIALNPGYATAHQWYALQLSVLGRHDEAVAEMTNAESLDPLSLIISADLADVLFAAGRYDEAMRQSRKTIDMEPNFGIAHYELGQAVTQKKQYDEAIAELQAANKLTGGDVTCVAGLAYAYAASGKASEALKLLNDLKGRNRRFSYPAQEAIIHASLGEKDQALALLEKAYSEHFDALALRSPAFDALRPDPRFQDLMRRIGLKQ